MRRTTSLRFSEQAQKQELLVSAMLGDEYNMNNQTSDEQFHSEDRMKLLSTLSLEYLQKPYREGDWK